MLRTFDDVAVVIVVSEVPCLQWVDGPLASPAVDVTACDLGFPLSAHGPEVGAVSALLLRAPLGFALGVMHRAVPLGYWLSAAWPTTDTSSPSHAT